MNPFMSVRRNEPVSNLISSAVLDYSACSANSYPGRGQLWENLCQETSADADPQSSGPLCLGSPSQNDTGAPTFVGRAGHKGSYFLHNGTSYFTYSGRTSDAVPVADGLWKNIHKTTGGQDFTFMRAFKFVNTGAVQSMIGQKAAGTNIGITIFLGATNKINVTQRGSTAAVTVVTTYALSDGVVYIIGVAHKAATNQTFVGIYGHDGTVLAEETLAHTYNACIVAPTTAMFLGVTFDSTEVTPSLPSPNLTRIYAYMGFNAALTFTQMRLATATIITREGL